MKNTLFFCFFILSFCSAQQKNIDFAIGLHNTHEDSVEITILDPSNEKVFEHIGKSKTWGFSWLKPLTQTGDYEIVIKFLRDTLKNKDIYHTVNVGSDIDEIGISIVLADESEGDYNGIIVDKYYGNKMGLKCTSNWDAQELYKKRKILVPDYTVTNTCDSTIYGIHHRYSSSMAISWIQLHYITFLRFQQWNDTVMAWEGMSCSAPRVQMELKKNEKGETLKDMELGCAAKNFKKGTKYRIILEYGINDGIQEQKDATETDKEFIYIENNVYCVFDEFEIK